MTGRRRSSARWASAVLVAMVLGGCAVEPLAKDHCRLSSDCAEGRVCVSSRCRDPFKGFVSDAGSLILAIDAGPPPDSWVPEGARDRRAPLDASWDARDAAVVPPEVRDAGIDATRPDAKLKRDAPPPRDSEAAELAPDVTAPADARSDLAADAAVDAPDPESDAGVDAPDAPPDQAPLAADVGPDVIEAGPPDVATGPDAQDAAPDEAPVVCGNGVRQAGEACDDGNQIDEDGCTNACTLPTCGDGIAQAGEECDDGNASDDDRCTKKCTWVRFKQIVGRDVAACALRTNGMVTCWDEEVGAPVPPPDRFDSIAPGYCGVRIDGTIACWGAVQTVPAGTFSRVAVGWSFVCGVHTDGALDCAGAPGAAGLNPPPGTFTRVAADRNAACAIRSDGKVLCWGTNPSVTTGVPTGSFVDIAVGGNACATDAAGKVTCWGLPSPTDPGGPGAVHAVVMGGCYACGVRPDASPICWRDMTRDCPPGDMPGPGEIPWVPGRYVQVAPWPCGILDSGLITCGFIWQLNDLLSPAVPPARQVSIGTPAKGFTDGPRCFLGIDGKPRCGLAEDTDPKGPFEQLVLSGISYRCGLDAAQHLTCWPHTAAVPTGKFRQVVAGAYHMCALDPQGAVRCWAPSDLQQDVPFSDRILQPPAGPFKAIAAGRYQTCGLHPAGNVECWGEMEMTFPSGVDMFVQLKPPPAGNFEEVAAGWTDSCARNAAGAIVCWGVGPVTTAGTAPTGLHGLSVGGKVACGLTADNELVCWGDLTGWSFIPIGPFRSVQVSGTALAVRRNGTVVRFGAGGGWASGDHLP
jgi:cysteine-rich repeat protein